MTTFKEAFITEGVKATVKRNKDSCVIELDGNTVSLTSNDGENKVVVEFNKNDFIKALEPILDKLMDIE